MDSGADPQRVRANQARRQAALAAPSALAVELGMRLLDHLDGLRIAPRRILVLGGGAGLLQAPLRELFPQAELIYADPLPGLLAALPRPSRLQRWLGAGREPLRLACWPGALPLRNGSIDLLLALGVLAWEPPARVFAEARRVLARDGLLLFHALGPDTLKEWRQALALARPGQDPAGRSLLRLADMHDLADAAAAAGLASPVVDMEHLTVHYPDLAVLLEDLRGPGGGNALRERPRGLMTPRQHARLRAALERGRTAAGLPMTLEAVYGHAWNTQPLVDEAGRPVIPIRAAGPRPAQ